MKKGAMLAPFLLSTIVSCGARDFQSLIPLCPARARKIPVYRAVLSFFISTPLTIDILPLSPDAHYHAQLADGDADVVIGNWPEPPGDLHLGKLFSDEVVCLVSTEHPAVRRGWSVEEWLQAEHIAPTATHPGARGVIDAHLDSLGVRRNITARCAHFGQIPEMVASSLLVLTTGRQYCERFTSRLPLVVLAAPLEFPPLGYYQLWHARTQHSAAAAWLRDCVRKAADSLPKG